MLPIRLDLHACDFDYVFRIYFTRSVTSNHKYCRTDILWNHLQLSQNHKKKRGHIYWLHPQRKKLLQLIHIIPLNGSPINTFSLSKILFHCNFSGPSRIIRWVGTCRQHPVVSCNDILIIFFQVFRAWPFFIQMKNVNGKTAFAQVNRLEQI